MFIQEILEEWKKKTNGYVKYAKGPHYRGDYYLSFTNMYDSNTHIHFITSTHPFVKTECDDLCYIVKRNDIHSDIHYIDENNTSEQIIQEMLVNYNDHHN